MGIAVLDRIILNCHICGISYSPVQVAVIPTDYCFYRFDVYQRLCAVHVTDPYIKLCEHLEPLKVAWGSISMADIDGSPKMLFYKSDEMWDEEKAKEYLDIARKKFNSV